jgi:CHAD domain-containing protein
VAVKKMRAVLWILHKLQDDFEFENSYAPYKKIFKQAGAIREELLYKEKIRSDGKKTQTKFDNSPLINRLNKELVLATPAFFKSTTKALPPIQLNLHGLNKAKIFPYCKKLLKTTKRKWNKVNRHHEFHPFRKHLKQLLYSAHLLSAKQQAKLLSEKEHKRIDKLQDLIGQWHDNDLLLDKIGRGEIKVSARFLQSIRNETKGLAKMINNQGNKL